MKNIFCVVILSLGLLSGLSGCSTLPTPTTQLQPGADLAKYRTYALAEAQPGRFRDPEVALRLGSLMRNHLAKRLDGLGLKRAPAGEADLIIDLVATISAEVQVRPAHFHRDYPISRWYPGFPVRPTVGITTETIEAGTLAVFAIDRAQDEPVWAGWIRGSYDADVKPETVLSVIDSIINRWPVKP